MEGKRGSWREIVPGTKRRRGNTRRRSQATRIAMAAVAGDAEPVVAGDAEPVIVGDASGELHAT